MPNNEEHNAIIEVKGLRKSFNDLLVLDKISFSINKGEILSILGPSGSGKTTLLKCLIGLETFSTNNNSVKIHGQNSNDFLKKNRIAFVPQRYSNYPWLNVFQNIRLGMINYENSDNIGKIALVRLPPSFMPNPWAKETDADKKFRLQEEEKDKRVLEIIETVGLSGFEKYTIDKLSGGMQQRVAIGRAIAQNTDIIAFDEPFGALDFKIREKLQLLVKKLNKTILFVTHDIEEALFIADKLIVLSKAPTSITNEYKLPFRAMFDPSIKFDNDFIAYRKEIQQNLSQADDLIAELRKTGTINSLSIDKILSFPFLDTLRNLVNENKDKDILLNLLKKDGHDFQLGVMLLRGLKEDEKLTSILINRFNNNHFSAKNNFYLIHELSYRVSDVVVRDKIWQFIKGHYQEYKQWEVEEYFHEVCYPV